jgi:hypothetical protein
MFSFDLRLTLPIQPCTYVTSIPKPTGTAVPHSYVSPPAGGNATWVPPVWVTTTETVSTLTTYCPVPTTVVQGSKTYTVTEATTLTITEYILIPIFIDDVLIF